MEITTRDALIITSALQSSPLQTANTARWECCAPGENVVPSPGADIQLSTAPSTHSLTHLC